MQAADPLAETLGLVLRGTRSASSLEGHRLDFKTEKPTERESCQDLAEASVCFANASGGVIVVGVAEGKVVARIQVLEMLAA